MKGDGGGEGPPKAIRTADGRRQDLKAGLVTGPVPQQPQV